MNRTSIIAFLLCSFLTISFIPGIAFSAERDTSGSGSNNHATNNGHETSPLQTQQTPNDVMIDGDSHMESDDGSIEDSPGEEPHGEEGLAGESHGDDGAKTIEKNYSILYLFLLTNLLVIGAAGLKKYSAKGREVA